MRIPVQVVASFFRKKPDRGSMSFDILIPAPVEWLIINNKCSFILESISNLNLYKTYLMSFHILILTHAHLDYVADFSEGMLKSA